tara:strand:- start:314 stop:682 length:369 start_codon:yes stop_codon:yes gene_type:complete
MKNLLLISLSFMMASCSLMQSSIKPVQVKSIAERPPMYHPPLPYPMSLSEVDWEVMTPELMEQYLQNLQNGDAPRRAYYSLSSKEYENLSMDMAEVTRYTKDILSIIKYYREYDKQEEKADE